MKKKIICDNSHHYISITQVKDFCKKHGLKQVAMEIHSNNPEIRRKLLHQSQAYSRSCQMKTSWKKKYPNLEPNLDNRGVREERVVLDQTKMLPQQHKQQFEAEQQFSMKQTSFELSAASGWGTVQFQADVEQFYLQFFCTQSSTNCTGSKILIACQFFFIGSKRTRSI